MNDAIPRTDQPRVVVTPLVVVACVAIWLVMLAAGVSPLDPSREAMLGWGANFGPLVAMDHQPWRLLTSVFLHFGLVHLALNMWCLVAAGPTVERLFGNLGFAALYLLSGLGGSVASLWVHPVTICAGASGAIFGVLGGLLGYIAVRPRDVPPSILKPMRSGATAFLGYNLILGFLEPRVNVAAHLGGLAAGFVSGLTLTLVMPRSAGPGGRGGMIRRLEAVVVLSIALALLARRAIEIAPERIRADPQHGPAFRAMERPMADWNDFIEYAGPILDQFNQDSSVIDRVADELNNGQFDRKKLERALLEQIASHHRMTNRLRTEAIPARNEELRQIRRLIEIAAQNQSAALSELHSLIPTEKPTRGEEADRPRSMDSFRRSGEAYAENLRRIVELRDAYFKAHGLAENGR